MVFYFGGGWVAVCYSTPIVHAPPRTRPVMNRPVTRFELSSKDGAKLIFFSVIPSPNQAGWPSSAPLSPPLSLRVHEMTQEGILQHRYSNNTDTLRP